jgi:hypothetical protein
MGSVAPEQPGSRTTAGAIMTDTTNDPMTLDLVLEGGGSSP